MSSLGMMGTCFQIFKGKSVVSIGSKSLNWCKKAGVKFNELFP